MSTFTDSIYLDTAGVSLILPKAVDAMHAALLTHQQDGKAGVKREAVQMIPSLRSDISTLLNCKTDEVVITDNTTHGVNIIAQGLTWTKGDNILIPDNEFPANVYPWLNLAAKGVEIIRIPTRQGKFNTEDIAQKINSKTRLLALSHVGYVSGFKADIETIGQLCADKGIHFFVDAAQSAGVMNIDVRKAKISALATCSWKWLRGPVGAGFLYCAADLMAQLQPVFVGAGSMQQAECDPATLPFDFKPSGAKFEFSSLNIPSIAGLAASIRQINTISTQKTEEKAEADVSFLFEELQNLGFTTYTGNTLIKENTSGIISIKHRQVPAKKLEECLQQNHIAHAHWHGYTRLSPAYDISRSALEQCIAILNPLLINN